MKFTIKSTLVLLTLLFFTFSCDDLDDIPIPPSLEIKDFVWKGLNLYYYWQADEPNLADNKFATQRELNNFLTTYESPKILFEDLLVDRQTDRFSVIFNDYDVLESLLQGSAKNNGVDFGLKFKLGSQTEIYGWVRYILPNSDASTKNIQRGDVFYAVNSIPLTISNYKSLLENFSYTLNMANYNNGLITPNNTSVSLTKTDYQENPVYISNVIVSGNKKIGYLMYNGFYSSFESQLNQVFAQFLSQGVTHLVLDLRYNSGGSVATATRLASMITGQFNGQLFAKQQWNQKVENFYNQNNPELLRNKFTTTLGNSSTISSLNLNKVYILTSKSSASASELLINGLKPYINVIQIGTVTTGKNVGSITLYDSQNLVSKNGANPSHKYAMQPIVLKIVNRDGFGEYENGLIPTLEQAENLANLGVIGNVLEPLLSTAINYINTNGRFNNYFTEDVSLHFKDKKSMSLFGSEMYLEKTPEGLENIKK